MGRTRAGVAGLVACVLLGAVPLAAATPAVADPPAPTGAWVVVDGDQVAYRAPGAPGAALEAAVPAGGPGYTTSQSEQNIADYEFVLETDAEAYRDEVTATALQLTAILGINAQYTVRPGNVDLTQGQIDDPSPGANEIYVMVSATSPCQAQSADWIGCGGPRGFEDVSGDDGVLYLNNGAVWLRTNLEPETAEIRQEVVSHEIGHALGLGHFNDAFEGHNQVMKSVVDGVDPTFQSGDQNGLRAQHPFFVDNDAFATPRTLGPEAVNTSDAVTRFASSQITEPAHAGTAATRSTWFTFTAPRSGFTTVSTLGANFDSRVAVYNDAASLATLGAAIASNDNGPSGFGTASLVGFTAAAGTTYRIAVDGGSGAAIVRVRPPSAVACDDVSTACVIPPEGVRVQPRDSTGSTDEVGEPNHAAPTSNQNFLGTMWFSWTAPRSGPARVVADRPGGGIPFLAVYTGTTVLGLTPVATTSTLAQDNRRLGFTAVAGTTYRIAVVASPTVAAYTLTVDPGFGGLTPVTPARVLETRNPPGCIGIICPSGSTRWPQNQPFPVDVTGVGGVPEIGVSAVVLNVTVADAFGPGFLTLYPTGQAQPTASNLNYRANQVIANLVTVKVGADGRINILSNGGFPNVIADVVGWYGPASGSLLTPVTPARIQDSRPGAEQVGLAGAWTAGQERTLQIAGAGGVPFGATAVVLNVTATQPTGAGFLTVWPANVARPTASNLNFTAGQTVPNLVVVGLSPGGAIKLFNNAGSTHVIADVVGYYGGGGSPVTPVAPVRLLDTRNGTGLSGPFGPTTTRTLAVTGGGSPVPAGATGVLLNVTVTEPTAGGFLTAFPAGSSRPNASNLNFTAGQTVPNLVLVKVGPGGVNLYNHAGSTQVIADVVGYVGG